MTLSYQTRLAFLFLLVLSVSQPTMITALSMQIQIVAKNPKSFTGEIWNFNDVDLDGLNGTLSNADWNDVFDAALFDIDVIYHRFFFYFVKYS